MIDGSMTSKTGRAAREKAIEDMRNGKKHFLFASYSLAKEMCIRDSMETVNAHEAIVTDINGDKIRVIYDRGAVHEIEM